MRKRTWFLLFAVAFGVFAYWWLDGGRYRFKPRRFGVVEAGRIYRSGQIHKSLIEDVLRDHKIRVIVDLATDKPGNEDEAAEAAAATELGIRKFNAPRLVGDGTGDLTSYAAALQEIRTAHKAEQPVLVHCAAGSQRTGACMAWYRMLIQGWDGPRAFAEFQEYQRWHAKSDTLVPYVNSNMRALAEMLVARKLIDAVPEPLPVFRE